MLSHPSVGFSLKVQIFSFQLVPREWYVRYRSLVSGFFQSEDLETKETTYLTPHPLNTHSGAVTD